MVASSVKYLFILSLRLFSTSQWFFLLARKIGGREGRGEREGEGRGGRGEREEHMKCACILQPAGQRRKRCQIIIAKRADLNGLSQFPACTVCLMEDQESHQTACTGLTSYLIF